MAVGDFESAAHDIGGAVSDLFGASGASASASSYSEAQQIALQNAQIAKTATGIQETQESRQIYQTIGAEKAGVGGAGFAASGTALDLLRSSASQGALTKALTAAQGAITENSYAEQAGLYGGLAKSAESSATGQVIGGIIQGAGGLVNGYNAVSKAFGPSNATTASAADNATASNLGSQEFPLSDQVMSFGGEGGTTGATAGVGADALSGDSIAALGSEDAAIGVGSDVAAGAAADAAVAGAAEAGGGEAAAEIAVAAWIICTELHRQGRMPSRIYYGAASSFLAYPERGKRGYYVWAIPSTRHLRAHPNSRYSRLLEIVFNARAEYISNRRRRKPTTLAGALVTHGLYAFCWALSWCIPARAARWWLLYKEAA